LKTKTGAEWAVVVREQLLSIIAVWAMDGCQRHIVAQVLESVSKEQAKKSRD